MSYIFEKYQLTTDEYQLISDQFEDLMHYAAWKVVKGQPALDVKEEDVMQDMRLAFLQAGSYYKRQLYLEQCLSTAEAYVTDDATKEELDELQYKWENRTKHGGGRRLFGEPEENRLEEIVSELPEQVQPTRPEFRLDEKFHHYGKSIMWNRSKWLCKKLSQQASFESCLLSLSEGPNAELVPESARNNRWRNTS